MWIINEKNVQHSIPSCFHSRLCSLMNGRCNQNWHISILFIVTKSAPYSGPAVHIYSFHWQNKYFTFYWSIAAWRNQTTHLKMRRICKWNMTTQIELFFQIDFLLHYTFVRFSRQLRWHLPTHKRINCASAVVNVFVNRRCSSPWEMSLKRDSTKVLHLHRIVLNQEPATYANDTHTRTQLTETKCLDDCRVSSADPASLLNERAIWIAARTHSVHHYYHKWFCILFLSSLCFTSIFHFTFSTFHSVRRAPLALYAVSYA